MGLVVDSDAPSPGPLLDSRAESESDSAAADSGSDVHSGCQWQQGNWQ